MNCTSQNQPDNQHSVLVVDDEALFRACIRRYLEDFGFLVLEAQDGVHGLELFLQHTPDLVLVDLRMPKLSGQDVLQRIVSHSPDTPVIVVSGTNDIEDSVATIRMGAWDFILKPIPDMQVLLHSCNKALERADLVRKNRAYQLHLEEEVARRTQELEQLLSCSQRLVVEAEQANIAKSEFLANISHQLRTPLNSVIVLAQILGENRDGNLSQKQLEYAATIRSSGRSLLAVMNDILDLSKVEAQKLKLNVENINLQPFLAYLCNIAQPLASAKGLEFSLSVAEDVPEVMRTDPQRLHQILKKLLLNSIEFTDKGSVHFRIYKPQKTDRQIVDPIAFAVQDTGAVISLEKQQCLFDPFQQVNGSMSRRAGPGLGLSIAQKIAEQLGGQIVIHSEELEGTTFTVDLPLGLSGEENSGCIE